MLGKNRKYMVQKEMYPYLGASVGVRTGTFRRVAHTDVHSCCQVDTVGNLSKVNCGKRDVAVNLVSRGRDYYPAQIQRPERRR